MENGGFLIIELPVAIRSFAYRSPRFSLDPRNVQLAREGAAVATASLGFVEAGVSVGHQVTEI
jgi:hypothetical protein